MASSIQQCREFVRTLEAYLDTQDLGALAAIRRGLGKGPGEESAPYRFIGPYLADRTTEEEEKWYYAVAALFAWHQISLPDEPEDQRLRNLGASFRQLADHVDASGTERRFIALLNCPASDLAAHLRHAIGLLKSRQVPVDWTLLLNDALHWSDERRFVQRRWARSYWRQ